MRDHIIKSDKRSHNLLSYRTELDVQSFGTVHIISNEHKNSVVKTEEDPGLTFDLAESLVYMILQSLIFFYQR